MPHSESPPVSTVPTMDIRVAVDPAVAAAEYVVDCIREAIDERGAATLAVSGGSTAPSLFDAMVRMTSESAGEPRPMWEDVEIWQVDERIAPDGDADRNAGQLDSLPATTHTMPVTEPDFARAIAEYAGALPERFDLVHLGLGNDGHTASWPPAPHPNAGATLMRTDAVFTIEEFNGRRRMTLGVDVVNAAATRVVLVAGSNKAEAVARWVRGLADHGVRWVDETLPIAAVDPENTVLFLDAEAAGSLAESDYGRER